MNQRMYEALAKLREAVARGNEQGQQQAAIEYCQARGADPFYRYALFPKIDYSGPDDFTKPLDIDAYSETEWQRLVRRVAAEQRS